MRSDRDHHTGVREGDLLVLLAKVNEHMRSIRENLESNPTVVAATRGCDIRRYRDFMMEEEVHYFEAYVEAKTHTGDIFCWSLDIILTSQGWKLQRYVGKRTSNKEQPKKEFEDFTFEKFDDLADSCMVLMIDFAESARNFDFRL
jgi:hypothetical protein